jgi:hypothetical protein
MITTTRSGIPGDALNVGLEGDQADVICAMLRPATRSPRFPTLLLYKSRQIYAEPIPSISKSVWFQRQASPKKALGVLWDFKGLQGSKIEK